MPETEQSLPDPGLVRHHKWLVKRPIETWDQTECRQHKQQCGYHKKRTHLQENARRPCAKKWAQKNVLMKNLEDIKIFYFSAPILLLTSPPLQSLSKNLLENPWSRVYNIIQSASTENFPCEQSHSLTLERELWKINHLWFPPSAERHRDNLKRAAVALNLVSPSASNMQQLHRPLKKKKQQLWPSAIAGYYSNILSRISLVNKMQQKTFIASDFVSMRHDWGFRAERNASKSRIL